VDRYGDAVDLNEIKMLDTPPERVIKFNIQNYLLIAFNFQKIINIYG